ncbi:MAG: type I DNA topoisomerase [Saccharofermentans sp.]|nr:type I DNA topoisomerase [Saccharofermentans sp.]
MGKNLVIVESPAKAKTIERYLGVNYKVTATVGHFRDLPVNSMGINVNNNFKPIYIDKNPKVKKELIELAKDADFVYIATDPDREGEAIAWHVAHALKIDIASECRITFNEITKKAVKAAIENPRAIDMDLVNAQQARRVLDRLVGYELSPLLCNKIRKGLSAGRVQSVVTKIVMDRDAEIDAFQSEDYWLVSAIASATDEKESFKLRYLGTKKGSTIDKPKNGRILTEEEANAITSDVKGNPFTVDSVKKTKGSRKPAPPFTTSTMQQEASRRLGFSTSTTTRIAQQLYEGVDIQGHGQTALVTYIRTDSVRVSEEAIAASHELITETYGKNFVSPYKREFKNRNSSQDAHEAIRPAHFDLSPEDVKSSLRPEQYKLYKLIWERFLASQMADAVTNNVTVDASCGTRVFRAQGETIDFPGFLEAYADIASENKETEETNTDKILLPELKEGQKLNNLKTICDKKKTLPPPHYTEATLIKAMEEYGIGRPSTYSKTISTVLDRKYIDKENKALLITELGKVVTGMLNENFTDIVDVSFTAGMENQLDDVEEGNKDWVDLLSEFYPSFHQTIVEANEKIKAVKIEEEKIGEKCPECGEGDLVIKNGRNGKFIACSCFPNCSYTRNIEADVSAHCPKCGSGLLLRRTKKGRKPFYVCDKKGENAECDFISWDLPIDGKKCEQCGSYMILRRFRGKAYPRCANPECASNARKKKSDSDKGDGNE